MTSREPPGPARSLDDWVAQARAGDAESLEQVVREIQQGVYDLALRFFWHPQDAEDATQEILVRVVTRLGSFRGESSFGTWVYRVATNALLNMKKKRAEVQALSFDEFAEDLGRGLSDAPLAVRPDVEEALLLEEVKIGCTTALLLCLDRGHRLAYILGEILELDHREAASALEITPAAYRKRLSRARARITAVMKKRCGLFDPSNACRCRKRVDRAVELGRVDPRVLLFAHSAEQARRFPEVLDQIRALEEMSRAAALYRSHPRPASSGVLSGWLQRLIAVADPGPSAGASSQERPGKGD